jgi:hypothetical protein
MLELLLILGVVVYLASQIDRAREPGPFGVDASLRATPAGVPAVALGEQQRLTIADTQRPLVRNAEFVRAYGLDPRAVRDIRVYVRAGALDTLPPALATLLLELHREGCVLGAETAALLFRGRALGRGEALFFALTAAQPMPRVVAFLGKLP